MGKLGEDLRDQGYPGKAYADIPDQSVWSVSMAQALEWKKWVQKMGSWAFSAEAKRSM